MKYIVAVSGGVDSVVLLDMLHRSFPGKLVVAHFDHGIRADSLEDAAFVGELAKKYGQTFETRREVLGETANEAFARERRYVFLRELAEKYKAPIVTAHHLDDLVETVAINLVRGTGWRGLAVFHPTIRRPLVDTTKAELLEYATRHNLQWREDSTNSSDKYLRNRIRKSAQGIRDEHKRELRALHARQKELRGEIAQEITALVGDGPEYSRYLLSHLPVSAAVEVLRRLTRKKLTRPQLERLLHAIKTAAVDSKYDAGMGIIVHFSTRYFTL